MVAVPCGAAATSSCGSLHATAAYTPDTETLDVGVDGGADATPAGALLPLLLLMLLLLLLLLMWILLSWTWAVAAELTVDVVYVVLLAMVVSAETGTFSP